MSSHSVDFNENTTLALPAVITPSMFLWSGSRGVSLQARLRFNVNFPRGQYLKLSPRVGYSFKQKQVYWNVPLNVLIFPSIGMGFEATVRNGNHIYSSLQAREVRKELEKYSDYDSLLNVFNKYNFNYYNDFYTGLFHDLPEVLTKDVITPIKTSVSGLAAILEEYEHDMMESTIIPLMDDDWQDGFRMMVYDPFTDIDDPVFGERDGTDLKACDLLAAYMEAFISRRYGITSNTLLEGERSIRDRLVEKGSGIGARMLIEGLDRMRI